MALQSGPCLDTVTVNDDLLHFVKEQDATQFSGLYDASAEPKMMNAYPSEEGQKTMNKLPMTLEEYFSEPTDTLKEYLGEEEYDGANLKKLINKVENKLSNIINDGSVYGQIFKSSVEDIENALKIANNYSNRKKLDEKVYKIAKLLIKNR